MQTNNVVEYISKYYPEIPCTIKESNLLHNNVVTTIETKVLQSKKYTHFKIQRILLLLLTIIILRVIF